MKKIEQYINEKFKISKDIKTYLYSPKTVTELRNIVALILDKKYQGTLNDIDTSNIEDMSDLFDQMNYTKLDLSNWNMSNVKNIHKMFGRCPRLKEVNCSNWDVSNIEEMGSLFIDCKNLVKVIGIENWKTDSLTNIQSMFFNCKKFDGDFSSWNVSNVDKMAAAFAGCENLDNTFENWKLKNNCQTKWAFNNCHKMIVKPKWWKE